MKNFNYYTNIALLFTALGCYACGGGGSTGGHFTEIDSAMDLSIPLHEDKVQHEQEETDGLSTGNSIKVDLPGDFDFNWEDFRNKLGSTESAMGEGFHQEDQEVATAWEKLNDHYSYRTVYRHRNGKLYLQTYYRDNDSTADMSSSAIEEGKVLTINEANDPDLQELWQKMEGKAKSIFE